MAPTIFGAKIFQNNKYFEIENNKRFEQEFKLAISEIEKEIIAFHLSHKTVCEPRAENPLIKIILKQFRKCKVLLTSVEQIELCKKSMEIDEIEEKVVDLISYIEYYCQKKAFIEQLSLSARLYDFEFSKGVFSTLKPAIEPKGVLCENLEYLLSNPRLIGSIKLLYFAHLTFVDQIFFMLEHYALLADFYFEQANIIKFNDSMVRLLESCKTWQSQNLEITEKLQTFLALCKEVTTEFKEKFELSLDMHQQILKNLNFHFCSDQPETIQMKPDFSNTSSNIKIPIGEWKKRETVSYAIQYEIDGMYSKISAWSTPYLIVNKSNPVVHLGPCGKNRVVYRQLGYSSTPRIVAILKANDAHSFHDIDRDLFDAASKLNEDLAIQEFEVFLANGANINAIFEDKRSVLHATAAAGNVNLAIKYLLSNDAVDVNSKDVYGYSALHIAAEIGYSEFVKALLAHKADINARTIDQRTALHLAAIKGHVEIIKLLICNEQIDLSSRIENGFTAFHFSIYGGCLAINAFAEFQQLDFNAKSKSGLTALHLAILNNDIAVTKTLLNYHKIDVNTKNDKGRFTPLHFAVACGNIEMVKLLLTQKPLDLNATALNDITALHLSILMQAEHIALQLLTAKDIDVNAKTLSGITPLHIAAQTEQKETAAKLLQKFAEVDARTKLGLTALHLAAKFGSAETLTTLLEYKANKALKTEAGLTPLMVAATASSQNSKVLKQLLQYNTSIETAFRNDEDTYSWLIAQNASLEVFKNFIENFKDLQFKDKIGNSLLHYAVKGENLAVIEYLLKEKHFDVNTKNRRGQAALHHAAESGSLKVAEYLLYQGANIEIKDNNDRTAIFYALKSQHFHIVKALLDKGANGKQTDKREANILHYAALWGNLPVVKFLIKEKCMDAKVRDHAGETAVFYAARRNRVEVVKYLVEECGINIRHRCHRNRTPFMAAANHNSLSVLKYLAEHQGAEINARDQEKFTALHFACKYNFFETIKYLLSRGANLHAKDFCDRTAILYAAEFSDTEVLKYLIEHGANIHDVNKYKITILHYAALGGNLDNVKYLVEVHNLDVLVSDTYGEIPVFYAARLDKLSVIKYFLEERKVNAFVRTKHNRTLLHAAYYLDIAKYLVEEHGLDINAIDKHYMTPLDAADNETAVYLKSLGAF